MYNSNNSNNSNNNIKILFSVLFLVGIGIVMVYSASSAIALKKFGTDYYFLKKQALFAIYGIGALSVLSFFPYRFFLYLVYIFLGLSFIFLFMLIYTPYGYSAGGSTRWLQLFGINFQPSEFVRFSLILYLAYSLSSKIEKDKLDNFCVGFLPHLIVLTIFTFFILKQPDFGTAVILVIITWAMLFISGMRIIYLFYGTAIVVPILLYIMTAAKYRMSRWFTFLNPWDAPVNDAYQIIHSLMAVGSGGIFGAGIGNGYQKLFYLPEPHTDFIFSVIGEEFGFLGILIILGLYYFILIHGIIIAKNTENTFGCLLAIGITVSLGLQVCVNMGVSLGLLPTKGLTLPFLSYGGTALLLNMASIGILLNIGASRS